MTDINSVSGSVLVSLSDVCKMSSISGHSHEGIAWYRLGEPRIVCLAVLCMIERQGCDPPQYGERV